MLHFLFIRTISCDLSQGAAPIEIQAQLIARAFSNLLVYNSIRDAGVTQKKYYSVRRKLIYFLGKGTITWN